MDQEMQDAFEEELQSILDTYLPATPPKTRPIRYHNRFLKRFFFDEAWELEQLLIDDPLMPLSSRHGAMSAYYRMRAKRLRANADMWMYVAVSGLTVGVIASVLAFWP